MLLIYLNKTTSRTDYIFKHICSRILELEIGFTSSVEAFVAHAGPKLSYGKQALAGEFFVKSHGLLFEQGFEDVPIQVRPWRSTSCFFAVDQKSNLPFDILYKPKQQIGLLLLGTALIIGIKEFLDDLRRILPLFKTFCANFRE